MPPSSARLFGLALSAVLTERHHASHTHLGGWSRSPESADRAARLLRDSWGAVTTEDCVHTLEWLYEQGHSKQYAELDRIAAQLPSGTDVRNVYLRPEDAASGQPPAWTELHQKLEVVLTYRDRVGSRRLLAWDMGRLVAVAGWSALAGMLAEDDAWLWIMRAARRVQDAYGSWREVGEHYVLGLAYWRPDELHDTPALVERLLASATSPWSRIAWTTDLAREPGGEGEALLLKRSQCHACGATKATRSRTAYVYCDHCGSLIDWDFQIALATKGSARPGPKYEELRASLKDELDDALAYGDRAQYAALQARLYDAYIDACPAAVPPRVGDRAYRARFVAYTVNAMVEQDFDEGCRFLQHQMDKAVARLAWEHADPRRPRVQSHTFWELFRAVKERAEAALTLGVRSGTVRTHPDAAPPELLARMGMSTFAQGWLPYLEPADGERLLDETGLRGDYQRVPLAQTEGRHCGVCTAPVRVIPGAVRVICEACGHGLDVGAREIACDRCGGPLSVPAESDRFPCPYCRCEIRPIRAPASVATRAARETRAR